MPPSPWEAFNRRAAVCPPRDRPHWGAHHRRRPHRHRFEAPPPSAKSTAVPQGNDHI